MEDEFDIVYRQLFRKYYANLLFYATRMVGEEDAEDVIHLLFLISTIQYCYNTF